MKPEDVKIGAIVCDVARGVVGKIDKTHEAGTYISPVNKKPVLAPVIELDTGESFVAEARNLDAFQVVQGPAEQFYRDVQTAIGEVTKGICAGAARMKLPPKVAFLILGRAFQIQGGILLKPEDGEPEGWEK
jgi:hypothetical protein